MAPNPTLSPIGILLRHWRDVRGMSQLDLALEADVSSRHISFVETGRSTPSREMVLRLADVLAIPLREQNALLEAAGYAALFRESDFSDSELDDIRRVIEFILRRHEPFSAVVVDRSWNVLMANRAHERMLGFLLGAEKVEKARTRNLLDLTFDPEGLRPVIENWEEVARVLLDRVHREKSAWPDPTSEEVVERLLAYRGVPERWRVPDLTRATPVIIPIRLNKDGVEINLYTAISTFGTPLDVTIQELRIETFLPADRASETIIREITEE